MCVFDCVGVRVLCWLCGCVFVCVGVRVCFWLCGCAGVRVCFWLCGIAGVFLVVSECGLVFGCAGVRVCFWMIGCAGVFLAVWVHKGSFILGLRCVWVPYILTSQNLHPENPLTTFYVSFH